MRLGGGLNIALALAIAMSFTLPSSNTLADEAGPVEAIKVDAKKAALGKRLFFDKRLSGDSSQSCATCHIPEKGFSDGLALSKAYPGSEGFRNTPTLINTALKASWFHDGRLGTNLNDVTRESLTEDYVMNMDMRIMQERIKQDPVYIQMFKDAGWSEPSNGSVRNAIPEYLKTLTSRGSPFDKGTMSAAAKRGSKVFQANNCASCHSGNRFTDDKPHNTAVPDNPDIWSDPLRHHTYVAFGMFMGIENIFNIRRDVGADVRSHKVDGTDVGKFMTPTLRELKYTAPYMHNGTIKTLADVVAFYNNGGGNDANKDKAMKPLGMSVADQADLVAYLESLSGDPLTSAEHVWKDKIPANYTAIADWLNTPN
ncbi:MAG: photosynthetic protein synthase I [Rhodospirillaceae bacterium]|nr:photosynthetic protein synthase I [Rhodospirillaceae bacterium]